MPFFTAENKIIQIHYYKFQFTHLLKKDSIIQFIQEHAKYALSDDFEILQNHLNRLVGAQFGCVDTQIKVIRLTPFLS